MQEIIVKTWREKDSLSLRGNALYLDSAGKTTTIPLSQVISFEVRDPLGKLFPGMITIRLAGSSGTQLLLTSFLAVGNSNNIEFPHGYAYLKAAREMQKQIAEFCGGAEQISAADEIRKYKALLDDGIISQEEFDAKKKQLLNL